MGKKPKFKRQEQDFQKLLKDAWRRPKGKQSKLRKGIKGRGRKPSPGYRKAKETRGLNRKGLKEIRIHTVSELEKLNPEQEAAIIGSTVGKKKRLEILKKAEELGITLANPAV
ncbi:MAG: 50S ribosomal protein L32e [Candidatus Aenigmatarchaeota archaeon]|nr:MAG: 50S ribosomal protein L32e [Candidatus Aenigmarchaeota archaeon]